MMYFYVLNLMDLACIPLGQLKVTKVNQGQISKMMDASHSVTFLRFNFHFLPD